MLPAACRAGRSYRCSTVITRASANLTGAYAEYTRVGVAETLRLPEAVNFHAGALVEPLAVGLNAVKRAGLQAGDAVLIIGAGPVLLSVALWCRFSVHATSSSVTLFQNDRSVLQSSVQPVQSMPQLRR